MAIALIGAVVIYTQTLQSLGKQYSAEPVNSYSDLGWVSYGSAGRLAVNVCILLTQTGIIIIFVLFIGNLVTIVLTIVGEQIDEVICNESNGDFCGRKSMYIWLAMIVLVPLCWIRNLSYLAYVSLFGLSSVFFGRKLTKKQLSGSDVHRNLLDQRAKRFSF